MSRRFVRIATALAALRLSGAGCGERRRSVTADRRGRTRPRRRGDPTTLEVDRTSRFAKADTFCEPATEEPDGGARGDRRRHHRGLHLDHAHPRDARGPRGPRLRDPDRRPGRPGREVRRASSTTAAAASTAASSTSASSRRRRSRRRPGPGRGRAGRVHRGHRGQQGRVRVLRQRLGRAGRRVVRHRRARHRLPDDLQRSRRKTSRAPTTACTRSTLSSADGLEYLARTLDEQGALDGKTIGIVMQDSPGDPDIVETGPARHARGARRRADARRRARLRRRQLVQHGRDRVGAGDDRRRRRRDVPAAERDQPARLPRRDGDAGRASRARSSSTSPATTRRTATSSRARSSTFGGEEAGELYNGTS